MGEWNFGGANGSEKKGGHTKGAQCLLSELRRASRTQPVAFTLGPQGPILPVPCIECEVNRCTCN